MKNPFTKKVSHNHAWYTILVAMTLSTLLLWAARYVGTPEQLIQTTESAVVKPVQAKTVAATIVKAMEPKNGHTMHVTGFSSVECRTHWCQKEKGQPRGYRVALNAKYGTQWSKVYVPAYGRYYDIAKDCGVRENLSCTTDEKTSLDIWFGDDHETALTINTNVLVYLIK